MKLYISSWLPGMASIGYWEDEKY